MFFQTTLTITGNYDAEDGLEDFSVCNDRGEDVTNDLASSLVDASLVKVDGDRDAKLAELLDFYVAEHFNRRHLEQCSGCEDCADARDHDPGAE